MKFEEILPKLRAGLRFRRSGWRPGLTLLVVEDSLAMSDDMDNRYIASCDILADDWELAPNQKPLCDGGAWGPGNVHVPCSAPVAHACRCKRCLSEPTTGERFYACHGHLPAVASKHERIRGRYAEWGPA